MISSQTFYSDNNKLLQIILMLVFIPFFYIFYTFLPTNSTYSFALFMDERITFEPVRHALNGDWLDTLSFFFDGHDSRYGRVLWNVGFVASYIPEKIFGEQGQIIATRTIQSIILMGGYLLIICATIKTAWLRLLCLINLFLIPESFYYFLMPKPEPFIILCIGGLLFCLLKQRPKHFFLLLGFLAGLKISTLPMCLLFTGAYLIYYPTKLDFKTFFAECKNVFSLKIILVYVSLVGLMYWLTDVYIKNIYLEEIYLVLSAKRIAGINVYYGFLIFNSVLSSFFIMVTGTYLSSRLKELAFISQSFVRILVGLAICNPYLYFTPFNFILYLTAPVSHGADDSSVNAITWLEHMFNEDFFARPELLLLFVLAFVIMLTFTIKRYGKDITAKRSIFVLLCALFLLNLLPIILLTKRVWGFYLLLPMTFAIVFYTAVTEQVQHKIIKILGVIFLLIYPLYAFPKLVLQVENKKAEEKQPEFIEKKNEHLKVVAMMNDFVKKSSSKVQQAYWDPNLFFPDHVDMEVKIFWGPFNHWQEGRRFVVLSAYPDKLYLSEASNKNYKLNKESISQYHIFTDSLTGTYKEYKKDSFKYYKIFVKR